MELARVNLLASNMPTSFWAYAIQHAVETLNRTTGPPPQRGSQMITSHEAFTGKQPDIMGIMPFGCRAHAVKPRDAIRKGTLDAHAWVGANLGTCIYSPASYKTWVPSTGRVHVTSDVVFTEHLFPRTASQASRRSTSTGSTPCRAGSSYRAYPRYRTR